MNEVTQLLIQELARNGVAIDNEAVLQQAISKIIVDDTAGAIRRQLNEAVFYDKAEAYVEAFLAQYGTGTRRVYGNALRYLLAYDGDKRSTTLEGGYTPLPQWLLGDARIYAQHCRELYSASKANTLINTASSFIGWCNANAVLPHNPFKNIKRSSKGREKAIEIPSQEELSKLLAYVDLSDAPLLNELALQVLVSTGVRVGALPNMIFGFDNMVVKESKGRGYVIEYTAGTSGVRGKGSVFSSFTPGAIQERVRRMLIEGYEQGVLNAQYSPHDLRHAYAVRLYTESGYNIELVRRRLNHSDIRTTVKYLQGLGIDNF